MSPIGNDSADGSESTPWLTLQHAATNVVAGDTVTVKAGTYSEYFTNKVSGTAASPITWQGERGENGEWLTILDPSIDISGGWVDASADGVAGGFKKTGIPFTVRHLSIANKMVAFVYGSGDISSSLSSAYTTAITTGFGIMSQASNASIQTKWNANATVTFWDGVEALWCSVGDVCYLRLRDGSDPSSLSIRASRNWDTGNSGNWTVVMPVMRFGAGCSNVVVQNFHFRNAFAGALLTESATAITVRSNRFQGGYNKVWIDNAASNNVVAGNFITSDFYGHSSPGAWTTDNVKMHHYLVSKYLMGISSSFDGGVMLSACGNENVVVANTITNILGVAVTLTSTLPLPFTNSVIASNRIARITSEGVLISEDHFGTRIYENDLSDCNISFRLHHVAYAGDDRRQVFIYRNRSQLPDLSGQHVFLHCKTSASTTQPEFWIYHNSFSGGQLGMTDNGYLSYCEGLKRSGIVNNIFSCPYYFKSETQAWIGETNVMYFDYNIVTAPLTTYPQSYGLWYGENNTYQVERVWENAEGMSFAILPASSATDAAVDVTQTFAGYAPLPLNGAKAGGAWDIGAYEYGIAQRHQHTIGSATLGAGSIR